MTAAADLDAHIPLLVRNLENALRAGYNVRQALGIVADDMTGPVALGARAVLDRVAAGVAFPDALSAWLDDAPSRDLDLVISTFRVQFDVGGNLADKLNLLGQIMAKRALPAERC